MLQTQILYPLFAMFVLVNIVLLRIVLTRRRAINNKENTIETFRRFEQKQSDAVLFTTRNFTNLFETPILFYVISILLYVIQGATELGVILAWAYVAMRVLHTLVHVTTNYVPFRFASYVLSLICLWGLWIMAWLKITSPAT